MSSSLTSVNSAALQKGKKHLYIAKTKRVDVSELISLLCAVLICLYLFVLSFFSSSALANEQMQIKVLVTSSENLPLASMIVEVETTQTNKQSAARKSVAVMDQIDQQFFPHILVVEKGQAVSFPNSDDIKHHVYSFSPTKTFEQQLYKGKSADPILFEQPGIVELGCNIHDWMQGFIYVAKGEQYAITDQDGVANINIDGELTRIHVWHPLMQEETKRLSANISALSKVGDTYKIVLSKPMIKSLSDYERLNIDVY